jgi:hypothetical protein
LSHNPTHAKEEHNAIDVENDGNEDALNPTELKVRDVTFSCLTSIALRRK